MTTSREQHTNEVEQRSQKTTGTENTSTKYTFDHSKKEDDHSFIKELKPNDISDDLDKTANIIALQS